MGDGSVAVRATRRRRQDAWLKVWRECPLEVIKAEGLRVPLQAGDGEKGRSCSGRRCQGGGGGRGWRCQVAAEGCLVCCVKVCGGDSW
jgi:hypothetical protein